MLSINRRENTSLGFNALFRGIWLDIPFKRFFACRYESSCYDWIHAQNVAFPLPKSRYMNLRHFARSELPRFAVHSVPRLSTIGRRPPKAPNRFSMHDQHGFAQRRKLPSRYSRWAWDTLGRLANPKVQPLANSPRRLLHRERGRPTRTALIEME